MKRMIHSLLAAAVLVSAMTCTAFAGNYTADKNDYKDSYIGTVTTADNGKSFTVTYEGANSGEEYVVLIVKTNAGAKSPYDASEYNAAKEENIIYINQGPADGTTITFDKFIPMVPANAVVLLGGVFDGDVTSPVILGELKVPYQLGDADMNGTVDNIDLVKIMRSMVGLDAALTGTAKSLADVDNNGVVDNIDLVKLMRSMVGLDTLS